MENLNYEEMMERLSEELEEREEFVQWCVGAIQTA